MDHLNIFNPFKSKANYHEDELTRVFLILLKNVNIVQAFFIEMIREEMLRQGCLQIIPSLLDKSSLIESVQTQITDKNELFKAAVGRRLVSIIISDEKLFKEVRIENCDRNARYDGVILYHPGWVLVIENKPSVENIWVGQLNPNVSDDIEIEDKPISLSWRKIIEGFSSLIERNLVQGIEKHLTDDFLEFIDHQYPQLNPYTNFSICKNNEYLIIRRCIAVMENSDLGKVEYHRGWKYHIVLDMEAVKQIALSPNFNGDEWYVVLEMYPGDTMNQARSFYGNIDKGLFFNLLHKGWEIKPNMHFSFRASNLVWTDVRIGIREYVEYWIKNKVLLSQINRNEFYHYFKKLEMEGMISANNWDEINSKIMNTSMQKINVCPGIHLSFKWLKKEAISLDKGYAFISQFKDKINEALATWKSI